jgi:hypothetical protein
MPGREEACDQRSTPRDVTSSWAKRGGANLQQEVTASPDRKASPATTPEGILATAFRERKRTYKQTARSHGGFKALRVGRATSCVSPLLSCCVRRRRKRMLMGWEVHITRAEDWADNDASPITQQEWMEFVKNDPELTIDPRNNGSCFALWLSHNIGNDHPWFDWSQGTISTGHPDQKTLGKAIEIAKHFGGTVQGDEGEIYSRPEDLTLPARVLHQRQKPWWRFW